MDITKITQPQKAYDAVSVRKEKVREKVEHRADDSVELSPEAVKLFQAEEAKKIDAVRDKVQSGFYSSPDVVDKVAGDILQLFSQA